MAEDTDTTNRRAALALLRHQLEALHRDFERTNNHRKYDIAAMLSLLAIIERG